MSEDWHPARGDEPACGPGQWRMTDRGVVVDVWAMTDRRLDDALFLALTDRRHAAKADVLLDERRRRLAVEVRRSQYQHEKECVT